MKWEGNRESGNLEDRRRIGGRGLALGGGGIIIMLIAAYFGIDPQLINRFVNAPQGGAGGQPQQKRQLTAEELRTEKFARTILAFTEDVWTELFQKSGKRYQPPRMVLFSDRVETGCGVAPSAVGPFYCPADKTVYLDPTFFDELSTRLGGSKAEFSQAYVIAHEIGHHVQNLLGYSQIIDEKRQTLPKAEFNQWSVRLELQADYLAGVWAHYGQQKFSFLERGDIESAITSARAIGDDRLQKNSRGFVSPESFTHGTSAQRVKWFTRGFESGDLKMLKRIFELPYDEL